MTHRCLEALGLCLLLAACGAPYQASGPVTPLSYQPTRIKIPRTVGMLRRLLVIPLVESGPKTCGGTGEPGEVSSSYDTGGAIRYLASAKGYEIVELTATPYSEQQGGPAVTAMANEFVRWMEKSKPESTIPENLLQFIRGAGSSAGADGVVVLHIFTDCLRNHLVQRLLTDLVTIGAAETDRRTNPPTRVLHASIYELATGRLIWQRAGGDAEQFADRTLVTPITPMREIFQSIEPAVPKVLTR